MRKKLYSALALSLCLFCLSAHAWDQEDPQQEKKTYFSSTSLSALLTSGNTKNISFSMDTDQNLALDKHKLQFLGQVIYTRSDGEKKSEIYTASLNYNLQFDPRTYFLVFSNFSRNVLSGHNFRFSFSSGAGYTWISREKMKLSTELALGWSSENNAEKIVQQVIEGNIPNTQSHDSSSFLSSIFTTKLYFFLSSSTEFNLQEILFLDLRKLQRYRLFSYAAISATINKHFALKTSIQLNYENRPVPGFKNTDLYLLSSIVFKI